jgi:cell division protein FtsB
MKPDEAVAHIIGPCVNQIDALKAEIHELTKEVNTLREALGMKDMLDMPDFRDYA